MYLAYIGLQDKEAKQRLLALDEKENKEYMLSRKSTLCSGCPIICRGRMLPSALSEAFSSLVPLRATYKWKRSPENDEAAAVRNTT